MLSLTRSTVEVPTIGLETLLFTHERDICAIDLLYFFAISSTLEMMTLSACDSSFSHGIPLATSARRDVAESGRLRDPPDKGE